MVLLRPTFWNWKQQSVRVDLLIIAPCPGTPLPGDTPVRGHPCLRTPLSADTPVRGQGCPRTCRASWRLPKSIGTVSSSCDNSLTVSSVCSVVDYRKDSKPFVTVLINGKSVDMEVDTGSDITCMSKSLFDKLNLTGCSLAPCSKLIVANGQSTEAMKTSVFVRFKTHEHKLNLRVVEANFPTLLGRDWMDVLLGENWFGRLVEVKHVQTVDQIRNDLIRVASNF